MADSSQFGSIIPIIPAPAGDEGLLCPGCGYDLRGSPTDRCSECGLVVDRAALRISAFPWAHRKQLGRFRAYWQTIWLILIGSRKLAWEAAKPQGLSAAKRFRWITSSLVATVPLACILHCLASEGPPGLAFQPYDVTGWAQDLAVPWSAGAANWFVMPILAAAMGFWMTDARPLFWPSRHTPHLQERLNAVACYVSAALMWLPILAITTLVLAPAGVWAETLGIASLISLSMAIVIITTPAAIICPFLIAVQWVRRVKHCGVMGGVVAVVQLLAWWLLGAIILLGVLPWCLGFLWLVIDSFR